MATKRQKHEARLEAIQLLGRPLARRARSSCELCGESGVSLSPIELQPLAEDPELERTLLLCAPCADGVQHSPKPDPRWRFLQEAVWAEFTPVQVSAIRLLRSLDEQGESWARDTLDGAYPSEDTQAWLDS